MTLEEVRKICHQQAVVERGMACMQLVYGTAGRCMTFFFKIAKFSYRNAFTFPTAGIGKTHYIRKQLANCCSVTVAVNESFRPIKAIQRLRVLPRNEKNCAIFFNFNLIPPSGVSKTLYYKPVFDYF